MDDNDLQESIQEIRDIVESFRKTEAAARKSRLEAEQFLAELEAEQAMAQIVVH